MATVVDIGANVGYFGLLAASLGHTVLMFEPMALNRAIVRTSMCMNPKMGKKIMLFPYGVGEPALCTLISAETNVGDGHTKCDPGYTLDQEGYVDRGRIQIVPLESVISSEVQIFFLKIDVEGFELRVMKTARNLLAQGNVAFILTEVAPNMMGGMENAFQYLELLWETGYEVRMDNVDGAVVTTREEVGSHMSDETGLYDCFCIHRTWKQVKDQSL
jgi:FkbM family methyltransferase